MSTGVKGSPADDWGGPATGSRAESSNSWGGSAVDSGDPVAGGMDVGAIASLAGTNIVYDGN